MSMQQLMILAGASMVALAMSRVIRVHVGRAPHDHRLGLAVTSTVEATAVDARSRLDTLRRLAVDHGQAWAAA